MRYSLRSLMIVAILGPPLLAVLVYAASLVIPHRFAAEAWKVDRNVRRLMVEDLMMSGSLQGKQKAEVRDMLGEPDSTDGTWLYEVSSDGSSHMWLELVFQNDKVLIFIYRSDPKPYIRDWKEPRP